MIAIVGPVYAQETGNDPGVVQITLIPGGATFVTDGTNTDGSGFGNYQVGGVSSNSKTPNLLNYSGNVIVYGPRYGIVPYATGGVGSLVSFKRAELGVDDTQAFLTGNVGGGVNWYAGRWGIRGDYRFIAIRSQSDAPAFFGQQTRYAHRVYGGVLLNLGR